MKEKFIKGLFEVLVFSFLAGVIITCVLGGIFTVVKKHGIDLNKPIYIQIVIKNDTIDFNPPKHTP